MRSARERHTALLTPASDLDRAFRQTAHRTNITRMPTMITMSLRFFAMPLRETRPQTRKDTQRTNAAHCVPLAPLPLKQHRHIRIPHTQQPHPVTPGGIRRANIVPGGNRRIEPLGEGARRVAADRRAHRNQRRHPRTQRAQAGGGVAGAQDDAAQRSL